MSGLWTVLVHSDEREQYGTLFYDFKKVTSEEADGLLAFLDELLGIVK